MQYYYKFYYQNRNMADAEYQKRMNAPSVIVLPLEIQPMDQTALFPLYYIPTNRMLEETGQIYKNNYLINEIANVELPDVASACFIRESLIDEMQNTNDIEGVRSTHKELDIGLTSVEEKDSKSVRFKGMAKSYLKLLFEDDISINIPEDIRKIYDELTSDEIQPSDFPDGKTFRRGPVVVNRLSGTGKKIHEGVLPETKIYTLLDRAIKLLKDISIPVFIRIAVFHYYFGYIHPFYDGNGRTSRFISNYLISKEIGKFSAISLSRGCNHYRTDYANLFEYTNNVINKGELNCFIEGFLDLMIKGQEIVLLDLNEKQILLAQADAVIHNSEFLKQLDPFASGLVFLFAQNYLFADDKGFSVSEIVKIYKESKKTLPEYRLRILLKELVENGFLIARGKRPAQYHLSEGILSIE